MTNTNNRVLRTVFAVANRVLTKVKENDEKIGSTSGDVKELQNMNQTIITNKLRTVIK